MSNSGVFRASYSTSTTRRPQERGQDVQDRNTPGDTLSGKSAGYFVEWQLGPARIEESPG